jgi:hypothetical protein
MAHMFETGGSTVRATRSSTALLLGLAIRSAVLLVGPVGQLHTQLGLCDASTAQHESQLSSTAGL